MEVAKETPTISKLEKSVRSHVLPELDNQTDRVRQKNYYCPTLTNDAILQVPLILWGIVPVTFWRIFLNLYGVAYVIYFFLTKMSIVYFEIQM